MATSATITVGSDAWRLLDELALIASGIRDHTLTAEAADKLGHRGNVRLARRAAEDLAPELMERALELGFAWEAARAALRSAA